jgi:large subunit ribosomal protein L6
MSKVGKQTIEIPNGITVTLEGTVIKATGPKGTLVCNTKRNVKVKIEDNTIAVLPLVEGDTQFQGLYRTLINNIIIGVKDGVEKKLEFHGIGYKANVDGGDLVLNVGYSHPVRVKKIEGVQFAVAENVITVSGTDKVLVGDIAAKIRAIRKPNPYKGKGIRYQGEVIIKKETKSA